MEEVFDKERFVAQRNIVQSEMLYGYGFQSPGGIESFKHLCSSAYISSGARVLEIGSGLGGGAFYIANQFGANVSGIDTAESMVEIANSRISSCLSAGTVQFSCCNIFGFEPATEKLDIIVTKDVLMYDFDKASTFRQCYSLLKPDGTLLISDFFKGGSSEEFENYMDFSNYSLPKLCQYYDMLSDAGFSLHSFLDTTDLVRDHLASELASFKDSVVNKHISISEEDASVLISRWERKIRFNEEGLIRQAYLVAKK